MNIFPTPAESHAHSLQTLNYLNAHNDFMDGLSVICDMGCGNGDDLLWWSTVTYEDENGNEKPRNYRCLGIDLDLRQIPAGKLPKNARLFEDNFETVQPSIKTDLIWSHDSFRYATSPLATLKNWNSIINENGMLVLIVPQTVNVVYNKTAARTFSGCYYNHTVTSLMYMLAVNGFDCSDGQFMKRANDPWIHCIAYKSHIEPMNPATTSWYDLTELGLLPGSAVESIKKWGYLKQEDLVTTWLDKEYHLWSKV